MTLFRPLLQNQNRIASHGILHGALLHGHSRRAVTTPTVRLNVCTPPTPTIPCLASSSSVASFCFSRALLRLGLSFSSSRSSFSVCFATRRMVSLWFRLCIAANETKRRAMAQRTCKETETRNSVCTSSCVRVRERGGEKDRGATNKPEKRFCYY